MAGTLAEKVWEAHVVRRAEGEPDLLYIDLHLLHEVTSPQAFDGLRLAGRTVRRTDLTVATEDHNVPTTPGPILDPVSKTQVETLRRNCAEFGVPLFPMGDIDQGIVHIIGPQLGLTQPGLTMVCGDSHTSTHGAFGALAFGIGTSEVEHVLATQTLPLKPFRTMAVVVDGELARRSHRQGHRPGGHRQDRHRRRFGPRHRVPRARHRGAVDGSPDDGVQHVDRGRRPRRDDRAGRDDVRLPEGPSARPAGRRLGPRRRVVADGCAATTTPSSTPWSTSTGRPSPRSSRGGRTRVRACRCRRACRTRSRSPTRVTGRPPSAPSRTWASSRGRSCATSASTPSSSVPAPTAGSRTCAPPPTSSGVTRSRTAFGCSSSPARRGSGCRPRPRASTTSSPRPGAEWRLAGCSMCLGMNPDQLAPGERSASTSNRNFEGRQGKGGRTHLVSPLVAAATAVRGTLSSPADLVEA